MHLSTHNWMRAEPLEVTLRRIQRLGYTSIELSGEPAQYDVATTRALLKQHGIKCWGSVTLTLGERNLAAKDARQRAATVAYMKSVVTMVQNFEGREVSVVPVTVGKIVAESTPEQEWAWIVAGLQEVYDHAQKAGVRLALEPINRFETYFMNRADQALCLADAVGPNCGICLDTFHMNIEEVDIAASLKAAGSHLGHVHFVDSNRRPAGNGHLDYAPIAQTLKSLDYGGYVSAEAFAWPDSSTAARQTIDLFRQLFR